MIDVVSSKSKCHAPFDVVIWGQMIDVCVIWLSIMFQIAISASNTGVAWDNAKKYIEVNGCLLPLVWAYVHTCTYKYTPNVFLSMFVDAHGYSHLCSRMHTRAHVHMYIDLYRYMYIHKYTHTHTHTHFNYELLIAMAGCFKVFYIYYIYISMCVVVHTYNIFNNHTHEFTYAYAYTHTIACVHVYSWILFH